MFYIQIYDVSLHPKPKWSPGYKISKYKRHDLNYVIVIIGSQKLTDPNIIRDIVKFILTIWRTLSILVIKLIMHEKCVPNKVVLYLIKYL